MIRNRFIDAACAMLLCSVVAHVQDSTVLRQGVRASEAQVKQLSRSAPLKIGNTSVWPVPDAVPLDQDGIAQPGSTLVVRSSDYLVGLSTNELVVMYPDTAAVSAAAGGQAQKIEDFPQMDITVLHVSAFSDLKTLYQALSAKFPEAGFDLPVSYAKKRPSVTSRRK